jgi:two-component system response regulator PilR (NtrC family)
LKDRPFVTINCGAIPENLMESEMFGHKKGSFTGAIADKLGLFEVADGGTLFLDEVGELPLSIQVKLLRSLQERVIRRVGATDDIKVDVRIIAATNRHLEDMVQKGTFRQDLYYRLNVIHIKTPSLRERKEDIPILAHHLFEKI